MTWEIKLSNKSAKALTALDNSTKKRIESFIDKLSKADSPRSTGKALQGNLKGLWRYRVGDYRLICQLKDNELIILLLEIGHRKAIYKN
ncbi:MAG: type II toxin-antitoxin system mRNA interferase toxin, RelE/StbE family [Methyloprofundus sp.]|nr:type II toxin-antitoxin system mRNA interferase toxin, RelE/StbE family [Methyloprofundus sp.]